MQTCQVQLCWGTEATLVRREKPLSDYMPLLSDVHFNFLMMDSENYTIHLSHQSSEISKSGSATLDIPTENLFQDGKCLKICNTNAPFSYIEPRLVVVSSIVKNIGSFLLSSAGLWVMISLLFTFSSITSDPMKQLARMLSLLKFFRVINKYKLEYLLASSQKQYAPKPYTPCKLLSSKITLSLLQLRAETKPRCAYWNYTIG